MRVKATSLLLPLDPWGVSEIEAYANACLGDADGQREFGEKFRHAVQAWRSTMLERHRRGDAPHTCAKVAIVTLGNITLLTLNAEVFSRFSDLAGSGLNASTYTIGCTNGMIGYLPTKEAYDEGAYEVLWSTLFYNMPRIRKGGFESVADHVRRLLMADHFSGTLPPRTSKRSNHAEPADQSTSS